MSNTIPGNQKKAWKYHDVDRGFSWIVLLGCFVMYMFIIGSIKAYGMLYTEMVEHYSSGSGNTAWIGSIASILLFSLGPVANLLCKIYTFRRVTMIGGIMLGLGYFLSGFVTRMEYMYITFLSTGIGNGFTFAPCSTIVSYYFDKRRALANGIMTSGSGVGAIALPFLYKYLIERYGLQGTFWILGAIFSNVCVAACVFRQPSDFDEVQQKRGRALLDTKNEYDVGSRLMSDDENTVQNINKNQRTAFDLRFSLFTNARFTLYVISFMCSAFGLLGSVILIPASVKALGYDQTYVALSVTIFGGVEVVTRTLMGWFADLNIMPPKYIYVVNAFIGGVFAVIAPMFESFSFIAIYAIITAAFPGSSFSLISVLIIEAVGLENFSSAFGLLSFSIAIGILPSQPAIGWLYDLNRNWHSSFILVGCMFFLAGLIPLLEPIVVRYCSKTTSQETSISDNQQDSHIRARPTDSASKNEAGTSDTSFTT